MKKSKSGNCHLHIIYLCVIFVIVLGFMILCFCKGRISENAFQNVSFAATVSSILLALISIVLSMNAANTTSDNLGSMNEVERKLNYSLDRLNKIVKIIKRTEKKIDKLPIAGNLEPSQLAADAAKLNKKSHLFMMIGHNTNPYPQYEDWAINKLCSELGLHDILRDVALKDNPNFIFDATASGNGLTYLLEVKFCKSAIQAREQFKHFMSKLKDVLSKYETDNLIVYLLFICLNNDNEDIRNAIQDLNDTYNSRIGVVFYNESDLKNEK